jgi:hypothetical protein
MSQNISKTAIALNSGIYFDFAMPVSSIYEVSILDIARGLANTCRFGGQCERFYSVAEHSVLASRIAPDGFEFEALMHDAGEALLGDVPKPLKQILPDYMALERQVDASLACHFHFAYPKSDAVKELDYAMLAAEQIQVMGNGDKWAHTHGTIAADVKIEFWPPEFAYFKFMRRYKELAGKS